MRRATIALMAVLVLTACQEEPDPNDTEECRLWQATYQRVVSLGNDPSMFLAMRPEGCDIP